jgi:hypothetical protein
MLSLWLVGVAGSREGTVQLAQEHDDGLFVDHGGCPFTVIIPPLGPDVGGDVVLLGDAVGDRSPSSGNLGGRVAVTATARKGHGPGPGEPGPWRPGAARCLGPQEQAVMKATAVLGAVRVRPDLGDPLSRPAQPP